MRGRESCRWWEGAAACARTVISWSGGLWAWMGGLRWIIGPRVVWGLVSGMDLSWFYARLGSRGHGLGRPAAAPAVLLSLWLYAPLEGVGSARGLAHRCESDMAYRWLCGGERVNDHGLIAFRSVHGVFLEGLLSEQVAAHVVPGLVSMEEVGVDGRKVRSRAGWGSFRSERGLSCYEVSARDRVAAFRAEKASRSRTHKEVEKEKPEPKVSTTDTVCGRRCGGGVRSPVCGEHR